MKGGCPAYWKRCESCKFDHFAKMCRNRPKHVREIELENKLFLSTVFVDKIGTDGWFETITNNQQKVDFKLDTGGRQTYFQKRVSESQIQ